ncbi:HPP family protein [Asanoa hainanensis]|uniref:HPP family protein n=1 Tax=Asanoa hainanensis TaxID=560556 RepID=A0A239P1D2_9ACTN|nr:HPP family protein [Asanoa hainanensis]
MALGVVFSNPLLIAPFGSTCMMIFGAPETPFARPRNVLGGHLICTATGLAALEWLGDRAWVAAIAVGVAMGLMKLTRTFHPPAGGDPIVVILSSPAWLFVVVPVLLGCVTLICVAFVFHKLSKRASYPLW